MCDRLFSLPSSNMSDTEILRHPTINAYNVSDLQLDIQPAHRPLVGKWAWEQVLRRAKFVHDEVRGWGEADRGLGHVVLGDWAVGGELLDELRRELSFDGVGDQAPYDGQELEYRTALD